MFLKNVEEEREGCTVQIYVYTRVTGVLGLAYADVGLKSEIYSISSASTNIHPLSPVSV